MRTSSRPCPPPSLGEIISGTILHYSDINPKKSTIITSGFLKLFTFKIHPTSLDVFCVCKYYIHIGPAASGLAGNSLCYDICVTERHWGHKETPVEHVFWEGDTMQGGILRSNQLPLFSTHPPPLPPTNFKYVHDMKWTSSPYNLIK